jgi:TolB-like protein/DNA-binding winged helix-turn-helix (wHTH) protein/predicted negative regulator of RcsB-dependent stress response
LRQVTKEQGKIAEDSRKDWGKSSKWSYDVRPKQELNHELRQTWMEKLSHQQYFFGEFTLNVTRGCLLRGGDEVKLRPKSFAVLEYLVENSGRLISKEQLIRAAWVETAVTDDSLVKCLKDIRQALNDQAQEIIKTVPRRGYIFAAEVRHEVPVAPAPAFAEETAGVQIIIEEGTNQPSAAQMPALATPNSATLIADRRGAGFARWANAIKRYRWFTVVSLMALAIVTAATIYFTRPGEVIDSIAVLPFVNVSNNEDAEYLSDGISDSLINSLSQLPNVKKVIPLSSVLRFKGQQIDPQAVGRELNVRAVLTGRLTQRGDEILISTELIDVKDNKRLWGGRYDRKLADIVNLQGEIAQEISEKLRLKLTGGQKERLTKAHTESAEAYQLYLQGRYYWHKGTDEARIKSGEYFQRAIEKDPNYALAYAGSSDSYTVMAFYGQMPPKEAWRKSEEAAVKALAIDDALGEAHFSLAVVKGWYDWDWQGGEREFKRAIELNPEFAGAESHFMYASLLDAMGRFDEAVAEAKQSRAEVGHILYNARRYDEAIEEFRKELEKKPNSIQEHLGLGEVYVKQGRYEEALAEMLKAKPLVKGPRNLARIGAVYAAAGKRDEAIKILEEVKGLTGERYDLGAHIAAIYAALGNKDQAFAWLDNAYEAHAFVLIELKVDPKFDTLRSDPRYGDLLGRMRLAP